MNHTPGPWIVAYDRSVRPESDAWTTIAQQYDGRDGCILPKDQQKANAHLIAAAPDLLDALVMAKNWMECDYDRKMCDHDKAIYDDIMESINKTIHKATHT